MGEFCSTRGFQLHSFADVSRPSTKPEEKAPLSGAAVFGDFSALPGVLLPSLPQEELRDWRRGPDLEKNEQVPPIRVLSGTKVYTLVHFRKKVLSGEVRVVSIVGKHLLYWVALPPVDLELSDSLRALVRRSWNHQSWFLLPW